MKDTLTKQIKFGQEELRRDFAVNEKGMKNYDLENILSTMEWKVFDVEEEFPR